MAVGLDFSIIDLHSDRQYLLDIDSQGCRLWMVHLVNRGEWAA